MSATDLTMRQLDQSQPVYQIEGRFVFSGYDGQYDDVKFQHVRYPVSFSLRRAEAERAEINLNPERSYWFCIECTMDNMAPSDRPRHVNDVRIVQVTN